jgi:CRISPR/Cas system-associated endonuclease Cas1
MGAATVRIRKIRDGAILFGCGSQGRSPDPHIDETNALLSAGFSLE